MREVFINSRIEDRRAERRLENIALELKEVEAARVCSHSFVTKEQYFKMDDILCECDLDMMPELE